MAKRILVVDDDAVGLFLMEARLVKAGYEMLQANNGQLGLDLTKAQKPDLIILDVEMPEMNGFTFAMELKKLEDVKNTPIIVLTAHVENKPIFHRHGIDNYLVKPVNCSWGNRRSKDFVGPPGNTQEANFKLQTINNDERRNKQTTAVQEDRCNELFI